MARGVNKVILIGNLGVAPEVRYMPSGSAMTTFSVATSESWKDKQTGERQDRTEWHRVVLFNKLAEIARDYLKKGSKVYIEGSLRTRKWQDKNTNQDRYTTEIMGTDIQMLDSRGTAGDPGFPAEYESIAQQMPDHSDMDFGLDSYGSSTPATSQSTATPTVTPAAPKDFDDDIPF